MTRQHSFDEGDNERLAHEASIVAMLVALPPWMGFDRT